MGRPSGCQADRGLLVIRVSPEALVRIDVAIGQWAKTAEGVSRQTTMLTKRLADDAQEEVRQKLRRVDELEAGLRTARGEARAAIARELRAATPALERARRGLQMAKEAQSDAQRLERRIGESTGSRVPKASADLRRRMAALASYSRVRLGGMVVRAVASQTTGLASEASDQLTSHVPERIADPVSGGLVLLNEVKNNWAFYSRTPELVALKFNQFFHGK
jgi:hypothetical protein